MKRFPGGSRLPRLTSTSVTAYYFGAATASDLQSQPRIKDLQSAATVTRWRPWNAVISEMQPRGSVWLVSLTQPAERLRFIRITANPMRARDHRFSTTVDSTRGMKREGHTKERRIPWRKVSPNEKKIFWIPINRLNTTKAGSITARLYYNQSRSSSTPWSSCSRWSGSSGRRPGRC